MACAKRKTRKYEEKLKIKTKTVISFTFSFVEINRK